MVDTRDAQGLQEWGSERPEVIVRVAGATSKRKVEVEAHPGTAFAGAEQNCVVQS